MGWGDGSAGTVLVQKHDDVSVQAQIHGRWGAALHGHSSGVPQQRWEGETGESPEVHRSTGPAWAAENNNKETLPQKWWKVVINAKYCPLLCCPQAFILTRMYMHACYKHTHTCHVHT